MCLKNWLTGGTKDEYHIAHMIYVANKLTWTRIRPIAGLRLRAEIEGFILAVQDQISKHIDPEHSSQCDNKLEYTQCSNTAKTELIQ